MGAAFARQHSVKALGRCTIPAGSKSTALPLRWMKKAPQRGDRDDRSGRGRDVSPLAAEDARIAMANRASQIEPPASPSACRRQRRAPAETSSSSQAGARRRGFETLAPQRNSGAGLDATAAALLRVVQLVASGWSKPGPRLLRSSETWRRSLGSRVGRAPHGRWWWPRPPARFSPCSPGQAGVHGRPHSAPLAGAVVGV
jgi:hypothetical protein